MSNISASETTIFVVVFTLVHLTLLLEDGTLDHVLFLNYCKLFRTTLVLEVPSAPLECEHFALEFSSTLR